MNSNKLTAELGQYFFYRQPNDNLSARERVRIEVMKDAEVKAVRIAKAFDEWYQKQEREKFLAEMQSVQLKQKSKFGPSPSEINEIYYKKGSPEGLAKKQTKQQKTSAEYLFKLDSEDLADLEVQLEGGSPLYLPNVV